MSDAELDAILNAVNQEIDTMIESAVDLAAGQAEVMRLARGEQNAGTVPELLDGAAPHWGWPISPFKELTRGPDQTRRQLQAPDGCCHTDSVMEGLLSRLCTMQSAVERWVTYPDRCDAPYGVVESPSWPAAQVRILLVRMECGLRARTLPRESALLIIDQLDCELRPLTVWRELKGVLVRHTITKPSYDDKAGKVPDPQELLDQLERLRQDVDELYDDGNNLVTC
ncbi:hypothetical protein AB0F17_56420 [Nonomuraea sp. NPDC026600]|uniref:hypothetical protein n=1 Tax=Nonomuraea sp. NPDC026600 TaxID=3155363 RepID=UPI0033ECA3C4